MLKQAVSRTPRYLLQWAAIGVLFGRAWQHLRWDAPFRAFFWDENLLSGLLEALGYSWSDWLSSPAVNQGIERTIDAFGVLYLLAGLAALLAFRRPYSGTSAKELPSRKAADAGSALGKRVNPFIRWSLMAASFGLFLLALLYWKNKSYQIGQLIEYSLQIGTPLFFLWALQGLTSRQWWIIRVAIALTFIGHGLYAVGFHPQPGVFLQMTMSGLAVSQEVAGKILVIAGGLDFLVAFLILLPQRPLARLGLYYCVFWGLLTTLARVWSNGELYGLESVLNRWMWESIYRVPHFLVPLALLVAWKRPATE